MTSLMVYLWTRADIVVNISFGFAFLFGIITALCGLELLDGYENDACMLKKCFKGLLISFILCMLTVIVVPSKKDIAMIYVIPKMANSQTFKELSDSTPEITKLALEALKETLQGMTKKEESK
jgi:hypothetical protein